MRAGSPGKARYHHGDLGNALVESAMELAREGGPEAVVLREAARRVGVSATAAYRHFANQADLLHAVKVRGQQRLAATMARLLEEVGADRGPREKFFALGQGHVRFAVEEPGLYRTTFCRTPSGDSTDGGARGNEFRSFGMLVEMLDELEAGGLMRAGAREGAEFAAWSTAHGLAMLLLDGPLSALPEQTREAVVDQTLTMIVCELTGP